MDDLTPVTRTERLLDGEDLTPTNREEMFIKRIYDKTQEIPEPVNRKEYFLKKAGEAGGDVTVVPLSVTANGTYTAPSGKAYTPVTVEVEPPEDSYQLKSITTPTPLATFEASAMPMPSLKVSVEAKQDLHEYDKPWVGGAGKNKLANVLSELKSNNTSGTWNGNVYTINGGTIEILTDTAYNILEYKVNGTFTGTSSLILAGTAYKLLSDFANDSNFVISQEVEGSGANGFCLQRQETGSNIFIPNNQNYTTISPSSDTTNHYRPILRFNNGDSIANKTYVLMIRNSADSSDFSPYSNICPISGWDAVVVSDVDDVDNPTVTQTTTISLGQTVYGGELDVVNGVLRLTWKGVDMGSLTWAYTVQYARFSTTGLQSEIKSGNNQDEIMCSCYDHGVNADMSVYKGSNGLVFAKDSRYTDAATFKQSVTGQQFVYMLETPIIINLTPSLIKSLNGTNNLSVDCGEILEGEYFKALGGE